MNWIKGYASFYLFRNKAKANPKKLLETVPYSPMSGFNLRLVRSPNEMEMNVKYLHKEYHSNE